MEPILILGIAIVVLLLLALLGVMLWIWGQTNARIAAIDQQITQSVEQQRSTTESFAQIQQGLGQLSEASRHMEQVGKEIASLGDLLRAPKLRGGIGEFFLGDLLAQMLSPEHYELQYTFRSGERVDAVVRLAAGMVPVDSKFPLESFQRMISLEDEAARAQARKEFLRVVKKHIDAIADKYIRPDEGTFDFALMYIPAENVYYEIILREEELGEEKGLLEHALQKHVIPVSPNSFYAYLQAIALGLRGMQIEQQSKEILGYLGRPGRRLPQASADLWSAGDAPGERPQEVRGDRAFDWSLQRSIGRRPPAGRDAAGGQAGGLGRGRRSTRSCGIGAYPIHEPGGLAWATRMRAYPE